MFGGAFLFDSVVATDLSNLPCHTHTGSSGIFGWGMLLKFLLEGKAQNWQGSLCLLNYETKIFIRPLFFTPNRATVRSKICRQPSLRKGSVITALGEKVPFLPELISSINGKHAPTSNRGVYRVASESIMYHVESTYGHDMFTELSGN